jgi:hypothetical protein
MCIWMAYSGDPILAEELLFKPQHSIIDQSLHSRLGATTTKCVGIGWYGEGVEGCNDSVTLFFLAITFGRTDDPFEAVSRAIGFVEKLAMITKLSRGPLPPATASLLLQRRARADHCTSPRALRHCVSGLMWRYCTASARRPG